MDIKYSGLNLSEAEKKAIEECSYEIINIQKFLDYLSAERVAEKFRYYTTSVGKKIDLYRHKETIISQILDLSDEEHKKILDKHSKFRKLITRSQNLKRAALGNYGASTPKLSGSILATKKAEIIEIFGKMYTIKEVYALITQEWGIRDISIDTLTVFYRDNLDEINRLQEKHKRDFSHLRLTTKTSRLEELTYLYHKGKKKYETSNSREDFKVLLTTMEHIRKEVEGDKLTINGSLNLQLQQDVNIHIKTELLKGLNLKEIIIGRLSSKMGIQPADVISSLHTSYYSKLNRLINDAETVEYEDVTYPSTQSYDFDKIKQINEKREADDAHKQKAVELNNQQQKEKDSKDNLKDLLLAKLKKSTEVVTNAKFNITKRL